MSLFCAAPGMLLSALVLLPFVRKAFTIDDTVFLLEARHLLIDPLHPTAFDIVWADVPQRLSALMASGPMMAYLLVPVLRLGEAEWAAHLLQLLFVWLAIAGTAGLSLLLGGSRAQATLAGLLLAATPTVLAMSGTAMPDVPAMAFGALAMERLFAFRRDERWHQGLLLALLLALALLTRSHMVLLLPLGALALLPEPLTARPGAWARLPWRWLPFVLAVAVVAAVMRLVQDPQSGGRVTGAIAGWFTPTRVERNFVGFLGYWTLALPLAIPWALLRLRRFPWHVALDFTLLSMLLIERASRVPTADPDPHALWFAPVAGLGGAALWDVLREGWRRRDRGQLVLGLWLLLALPVVAYTHIAPKYLIASAPALAVLLARQLLRLPRLPAGLLTAGTVCCGVALAVLILRADAAFAGLGRQAAAEWIAPRVGRGERVWFVGHWGFHWYALRAGARPVTRTPPFPGPGDTVVASMHTDGHGMIDYVFRKRLVQSLPQPGPAQPGGRIMGDGAGFFANYYGYLPWTWGRSELERFNLWRVE